MAYFYESATWKSYENSSSSSGSVRYHGGSVAYNLIDAGSQYKVEIVGLYMYQSKEAATSMSAGTAGLTLWITDGSALAVSRALKGNAITWSKSNTTVASRRKAVWTGSRIYTYNKQSSARSITVTLNAYKSGGSAWKGSITSSFNITIPALPKTSDVSVQYTNVDIGNTVQEIYITPYNSLCSHKLYYQIKNSDDSWGAEQDISSNIYGTPPMADLVIPTSIISSYLPNSNYTEIRVRCEASYSGVVLGSTYAEFTAYIPNTDEFYPKILEPFILIEETADLPTAFQSLASNNKYIQTLSNLTITTYPQGVYGSTISFVELNIGSQTWKSSDNILNNIIFNSSNSGELIATLAVTDSRGRTTSLNIEPIHVIPYTSPTISNILYSQSNGILNINIDGYISNVENLNAAYLTIKYREYNTSDLFKIVVVYNYTQNWNINVNKEIRDASIISGVPYEVIVHLNDYVDGYYEKTLITSLLTGLIKTNYGYSTFAINPSSGDVVEYGISYLQNAEGLYWELSVASSNMPASFATSYRDDVLMADVGYSSDRHLVWRYDYDTDWNIEPLPSAPIGIANVFNRVVILCDDNHIYWVNPETEAIESKDLGVDIKFIIGNNKLMLGFNDVKNNNNRNGYCLNNISDENLTEIITDSNTVKTLNDFNSIRQGTKFAVTDTSIVGIINTEQGWKIMRTPTVSLR